LSRVIVRDNMKRLFLEYIVWNRCTLIAMAQRQ